MMVDPPASIAGLATQTAILACTGLVLIASIILGGGTRPGFMGDVILQLLAIPPLLLAINAVVPAARLAKGAAGSSDRQMERQIFWAAMACGLVCFWPLLQLVPLPPALWTKLPDREYIANSYALLGQPLPWWPISMLPHATWIGWLSLLPPAAVFLGTILLGYRARRSLVVCLLAIGLLSVLLGLVQVAEGPTSSLRFFAFTNPTEAVGFFANRNHYAALLYCLTLLVAPWAIEATISTSVRNRWMTSSLIAVVGAFAVIVVLIGAQAMARSRAGIGLSMLALLGAFAFAMVDRRTSSAQLAFRLMAAAVALAIVFAMQFALYRVMDRFGTDPLADWRLIFTRRTYAVASEHWLFGSGIGTFVPVYGLHERSQDLLANTFVNHAHNDIVQLLLEAGAPGALLMLAAGLWLTWRMTQIWRQPPAGVSDLDQGLARAATLMLLLIAIHSFVDYPLRTGAMLAVTAFAMALLVPPPAGANAPEDANLQIIERPARRERTSSRQRQTETAKSPALSVPGQDAVKAPVKVPAAFQWPSGRDASTQASQSGPPPAAPSSRANPNLHWPKQWAQPEPSKVPPPDATPPDGAPPDAAPPDTTWPPPKKPPEPELI